MTTPVDIKVALVHDWLNGMRGGEKCLEEIIRLYPRADIFTLLHEKGKLSATIEKMNIHTSFIQKLPFSNRHYRNYLPLFPYAVESFDLSGYDLVISTSHCAAKGVMTGPDTCHICYCFTPMRYAWDQYNSYFGHLSGIRAAVVGFFINRLRTWDVASTGRVDHFLTISRYVARRIWKYYRRESRVIYPPVDTGFFVPSGEEGDYYLAVSALVPYKRLDLVVEAAGRLDRPVKIVGTGPEESRLRASAGSNIQFLGWLKDADLLSAYQGCRALLFPGEEDFGLAPVEAMACGKPVIAYGRGGASETIIPLGIRTEKSDNTPTGVFFNRQSPEEIIDAVGRFEKNRKYFNPDGIRARAEEFSPDRFTRQITEAVEELYGRFVEGEHP